MKNKEKIDEEIFKNTKEKAEEFYKKINKVYCPYLKTTVNFNSKGLSHIKMKGRNKARARSDQYLRLKFLELIPYILLKSGTLQEFNKKERIKYFGFIAIINNIRLKIIIKQKDYKNTYFWSIIPFWKKKKDKMNKKIKKVFCEGDLQSD